MRIKQYIKKFLISIGLLPKNYFVPRKLEEKDYHKPILSLKEANELIRKLLNSEEPILVSRFGDAELSCCAYYHRHLKNKKRSYPEFIKNIISSTGFFPISDSTLDEFSRIYLDSARKIDALGIWYNFNENLIAKEYCPKAELIPLPSIEPYYHPNPWSIVLAKKTVLVIHPFAETINEQFKKRENLFNNKDILPNFELKTIKAVQSIAGEKTNFISWFEALNYMYSEIKKTEFDVAIIGAGAYGLPLGAFVKGMGKKAIHMGGATQILFGIKGRRWDSHEFISKLYNDYWVRPSESERPVGYKKVEDGCYW